MTPLLYYSAKYCLPDKFNFPLVSEGGHVTSLYAFACTALGLWSGLTIGICTEYFTSTDFAPV